MKRTAKCVLAALICLLFLVPVLWTDAGAASGTCGENLTWTLSSGTLTISGRGEMTDYESEGAPWYGSRTSVKKVVVQPGVSGIGSYAFQGCTALTDVNIAGGVLRIGSYAFYNCDALTAVVIPYGVTVLQKGAFCSCDKLASVTFPTDLLTEIGENAFLNCKALTYIEMPDSVTTIGAKAFSNCNELADIRLSENLSYIGSSAFWECEKLTSISIPASVTYIGEHAFYFTWRIESIYITDLAAWCNIRFANQFSTPITAGYGKLYLNGEAIEDLVIPEGVTSINEYAFCFCPSIKTVTFPNSLVSIEENAFWNCLGLTSVTLSDGLERIEESAFASCTKLTGIVIPARVTSIAGGAFNNCSKLAAFDVVPENPAFSASDGVLFNKDRSALVCYPQAKAPADGAYTVPDTVTQIGSDAFSGCSGITSLTLPEGLTSIGSSAFSSTGLTELEIPASVTELGSGAFTGCADLTNVRILGSVPVLGDRSFLGCYALTGVLLPDSLTEIGKTAFKNCRDLTSITIPDGVTAIGDEAFYGCSALESVVFPASLEAVGEYAFQDCIALTAAILPDGLTELGSSMFRNCTALAAVTLPENLTRVTECAFFGCSALASIDIPDGVTHIGNSAFRSCTSLASAHIPDGVISIGCSAFYQCSALRSVTIPASVIELPLSSNSVYTDYSAAFQSCSSLTELTLTYRLPCIPKFMFYSCTALQSITFYGTEEEWAAIEIDEYNSRLTSVTVQFRSKLAVTEQPQQAAAQSGETVLFHTAADGLPGAALTYRWQHKALGGQWTDCEADAGYDTDTLTVPATEETAFNQFRCVIADGYGNSVTTEAAFLFVTDSALTDGGSCGPEAAWMMEASGLLTIAGTGAMDDYEMILGDHDHWISAPWEAYSRSITAIEVRDGVTRVGNYAFYGLTNLTSVSFPPSLRELGSHLFYGSKKLLSLSIPSGVTKIEAYAIQSCSGLTELILPESLTELGKYALANCTGLTSITIPEGVRVLPSELFNSCSGLTEINLPDTLTTISGYAFARCEALTGIRIPDSVTFIGGNAFSFCTALTSLTFPEGLTAINDFMFDRCSALTSVVIPASVTSIGTGAFGSASALTDVYFCGTEEEWAAVSIGSTNSRLLQATMHYGRPLFITQQPADYVGAEGSTAAFTVVAEGAEPLTYQWWIRNPSENEFKKSTRRTATYSTTLKAASSGRELYCVVTDANGNSVQTDVVTMTIDPAALIITQQPVDYVGAEGSTASFTVVAEGNGPLTYQWWIRNPGENEFTKSTRRSATYSTTLKATSSGRELYCVVTDANGNTVTSDTVTMTIEPTLTITQQPVDYVGVEGSTASFTVVAEGEGPLTYQWWIRNPGENEFKKSTRRTATYSTTLKAASSGRELYCVVTDAGGNSVTSDVVTMTIEPAALAITQQPVDYVGAEGSTASFTVVAEGNGPLTYQWWIRNPGENEFTKSTRKTATYSTTLKAASNGRELYCVVTDANGNSVQTNTVTMTIEAAALTITQQPVDYVGVEGSTASFTVVAEGNGPLTYQWWIRNPVENEFTKSTRKTATYSTTLKAASSGRELYCVVTDAGGNSVQTDTVTMTIG